MRRHPFQRGKLVRTQPQDVLQLGIDAGPAMGDQRRELGVERAPLPQHAGGQLMGQPAVGLRQLSGLPIERQFKWLSLSNLTEDGQSRATGLETDR